MRREALAVSIVATVAACGTPTRPMVAHREPPRAAHDAGMTADASVATAIVRPGSRVQRIEAPHAGAIMLLAATPDGTAVVSTDELGGVRLWPALDGSLEPRVIDLPRPRTLALGLDPRGFAIAMTDQAGGLVIQRVDRDGLTIQRAALPIEPAYAGVAGVTARGVLAWRVDQRVIRLTVDGAITHDLPTEAGQRILTIMVAGERAVAVLETPAGPASTAAGPPAPRPTRRARWLQLGAELAWGGWIDTPIDLGAAVALSPSGKRLASLVATPRHGMALLLIDTATGALVASPPASGAVAVGLPSDDHLAFATASGITWLTIAKLKAADPTIVATPPLFVRGTFAHLAGGRAVGAVHGELVIASPDRTEFLGYELTSLPVTSAAPNGGVLIGTGETVALLDPQLVATSPLDLRVPAGADLADARWLGGTQWLVQTMTRADGLTSVALVDTATKRSVSVRSSMPQAHLLLHEPGSQLVTFSLGDSPEVLRHVPAKLRLDSVAKVPGPTGFHRIQLVPVDPALANGSQLVAIEMRDRLTIRWLANPGVLALTITTPLVVEGSLASVDAAGRVYVWQSITNGLELVVFADGKRIATLPTTGATALWPDRKGTSILQVSHHGITLVGNDLVRRWALPVQGVTEALWLDDGSLAIVSGSGIARLEAATGKLLAARCGWRFGLGPKLHPVPPRIEPICSQLR